MKTFTLDEQETNFTIEATDRTTLRVFSNDPVWQKRIDDLGVVVERTDGYGKFYLVDLNQFNLGIYRKRQYTDEQREAMAERLAEYRAGV